MTATTKRVINMRKFRKKVKIFVKSSLKVTEIGCASTKRACSWCCWETSHSNTTFESRFNLLHWLLNFVTRLKKERHYQQKAQLVKHSKDKNSLLSASLSFLTALIQRNSAFRTASLHKDVGKTNNRSTWEENLRQLEFFCADNN